MTGECIDWIRLDLGDCGLGSLLRRINQERKETGKEKPVPSHSQVNRRRRSSEQMQKAVAVVVPRLANQNDENDESSRFQKCSYFQRQPIKRRKIIIQNCLGEENNRVISRRKRRNTKRLNLYANIVMVMALAMFLLAPANGQQFSMPRIYDAFGNQPQQQWPQAAKTAPAAGDSVSIRLIDEILEIFVPPKSFQQQRKNAMDEQQQQMPIPYGLNKLLPRRASSEDLPSERWTPEVRLPAAERHFSPVRQSNIFGAVDQQEQQAPWANLARDLMGIFRAIETTTPAPTTTTTTTQMSLLERIMPKFLNPFGMATTAPPPPPMTAPALFPFFTQATTAPPPSQSLFSSFFRQEQPKRPAGTPNPLVAPMAQLLGVEKKAVEDGRAQIDTGGQNFDRFVVREKLNPDNPLAAIVGGSKWNERGIKWEDGNIRLVNKNGNSLLGSEMGVHDHSLDIPLRRWLDIANGFVNFNQVQQDRVRRW